MKCCGQRTGVKQLSTIRAMAANSIASPKIVQAISDGNAPSDFTISLLARTLPHDWAEQERYLT